jgi:uncharacterized protein YwgA
MQPSDFVLLAYDALGGKINGSTNLQKKVYFLSIMLDREDFGYDAHYYGPYSPLVASVNRELKSLGFIQESVASSGAYDQRGFEVARHDFELTDDGRSIVCSIKKRHSSESLALQNAAKKLEALGDIDYVQLSIAAKAYFLLCQTGKPTTNSELAKMARKFNWKVSETDIQRAVESLYKLGLAAVN